jgi:cilia- and flagella-associated protein 251
LQRAFGFNKDLPQGVINVSDHSRKAVFYAVGHTGVLFDYERNTEILFQGHRNPISCIAASGDRRWIVTADRGPDESLMIIWDSRSGNPLETILNPHPGGVCAIDMSDNAVYLATLSDEKKQVLSIWEWAVDASAPIVSAAVVTRDRQKCIRFHRKNSHQLISNGARRVIFWDWSDKTRKMKFFSPPVSSREFKQSVGEFTMSVFLPEPHKAVTATSDGDLVTWEMSSVGSSLETEEDEDTEQEVLGGMGEGEMRATKVVRVHHQCVHVVDVIGQYIVSGAADGFIRFFVFDVCFPSSL